jgi:DNA (cytosine-5)-methyltransferase 1
VNRLPAVSLFSNCGAGDLGYANAGFRFKVMAELDDRRLSVALLNHSSAVGVAGDLRTTLSRVIAAYRKAEGSERPALLCACPPCQGLSSLQSLRGAGDDADAGSRDARNLLVQVIVDAVRQLRPRVVVVENVPTFLTRKVRHPAGGAAISAATILTAELAANYVVYPLLADLADYGVPQARKRAFLTFVRKDEAGLRTLRDAKRAPFPRPTHAVDYGGAQVSVRDAFRTWKLAKLDARTAERARSDNEFHYVPVWDARRYALVSAIPPNHGGSAWENTLCIQCGNVNVDDNDATCPVCSRPLLRPIAQDANGRPRLIHGFRNSSYRRMRPDRPAATITTASGHMGSSRTLHPSENRVLSPLECALLQTFPLEFRWGEALDKWGATNVRAMIGEAVPPMFTELHGRVLMGLLTQRKALPAISLSDPRVSRAIATLARAEREKEAAAALVAG